MIPSGYITLGGKEPIGKLTPVNYDLEITKPVDRSFFNFWLGWDAIKNTNVINRFKKISKQKCFQSS